MWDWNKSFCLGDGERGGGWESQQGPLLVHSGVFWGQRLQRVMEKQQLPLEVARVRTATRHRRPQASGGKASGYTEDSSHLRARACEPGAGRVVSPPLLWLATWGAGMGTSPRAWPARLARGRWCPRGQDPPALPSRRRSGSRFSLSSLHLRILRGKCLLHVLETALEGMTDEVSGVGRGPAVAAGWTLQFSKHLIPKHLISDEGEIYIRTCTYAHTYLPSPRLPAGVFSWFQIKRWQKRCDYCS